ncbi:MAG: hypothetical protein GY696_25655 [Gammaproteobacteria bacterium]|nr:hypothetical protein [Gammaproteobacteria bacterium]
MTSHSDRLSNFTPGQLMEELFLHACACEIPKLFCRIDTNGCYGCDISAMGQGGHECLSGEDGVKESMLRNRVAQAVVLLQSMPAEIMLAMDRLYLSTSYSPYNRITLYDMSNFWGNPYSTYPLIRVAWDVDWQFRIRNLILEMDNKYEEGNDIIINLPECPPYKKAKH